MWYADKVNFNGMFMPCFFDKLLIQMLSLE